MPMHAGHMQCSDIESTRIAVACMGSARTHLSVIASLRRLMHATQRKLESFSSIELVSHVVYTPIFL